MKASEDQPTAAEHGLLGHRAGVTLHVQSKAWQPGPWRRLQHSLSGTHSKTSVLKPG